MNGPRIRVAYKESRKTVQPRAHRLDICTLREEIEILRLPVPQLQRQCRAACKVKSCERMTAASR